MPSQLLLPKFFSEPSERSGNTLSGLALAAFAVVGCDDGNYQDYSKAPLSEEHDHDHGHDHNGHAWKVTAPTGRYSQPPRGNGFRFGHSRHHAVLLMARLALGNAATELAFEIEKDGAEVVLEAKASPLEGEPKRQRHDRHLAGRSTARSNQLKIPRATGRAFSRYG